MHGVLEQPEEELPRVFMGLSKQELSSSTAGAGGFIPLAFFWHIVMQPM